MKKFARILALAMAMMLALSCAFAEQTADATQAPDAAETQAPAEETAEDENPVLFSFDGKEFRRDEVDVVIQNLLNGGLYGSLICHINTHMLHAFYGNITAAEFINCIACLA